MAVCGMVTECSWGNGHPPQWAATTDIRRKRTYFKTHWKQNLILVLSWEKNVYWCVWEKLQRKWNLQHIWLMMHSIIPAIRSFQMGTALKITIIPTNSSDSATKQQFLVLKSITSPLQCLHSMLERCHCSESPPLSLIFMLEHNGWLLLLYSDCHICLCYSHCVMYH